MIRTRPFVALALGLGLVLGLTAPAAADTTIHTVFDHYQAVRLAMVDDRVDTAAAEALDSAIGALHADFSASAAEVDADSADSARELLGTIHEGTRALVAAGDDLAAARDALYQLTQPLVRYRELMVGDKPAVAYCPMSKKSWLQLETDTIGNPYHGSEMPKCGSIVSK